MVIHTGTALNNHSIGQLVKDVRNMMQPHTAIRLKERRSNKVKDFVAVSASLGISFMMLFSQNENTGNIHFRVAKMSHGPTISFKIMEYSLCKDIARSLKSPKSLSKSSLEFQNPPLLVLNGFTNPKEAEPHEKLVITMFQNMFPPINPQSIKVNTIRRVMLVNKDKKTGLIDIRHYVIDTKLVDVSKNVRKLVTIRNKHGKKLPNLSKADDVADIILDPYAAAGFTSESEVETDAVVEVREEEEENITKMKSKSTKTIGVKPASTGSGAFEEESKGEDGSEKPELKRKKAVKLTEIGPRMKLRLEKIEEAVCDGKVLYHWNIHKSEKEINKMEQVHSTRKKQKLERKQEQKENVEKKKKKHKRKVRFVQDAEESKNEDREIIDNAETNTQPRSKSKRETKEFIPLGANDEDDDSDQLFDEK